MKSRLSKAMSQPVSCTHLWLLYQLLSLVSCCGWFPTLPFLGDEQWCGNASQSIPVLSNLLLSTVFYITATETLKETNLKDIRRIIIFYTNKCNTRPTLSSSPVKEITVSKVNSPISSLIYWIKNYMYIESVNVCVCVLPWAQENNLGGQWEERRHKSRRYIYLQKDTQRKKRVKSKILE